MNLENIQRAFVKDLQPYSSARDEFATGARIYLDANESPYESDYNRYPDPYQSELKKKIGEWKSIGSERIFLGNGSDEILDLLFRVFCEPSQDYVVAFGPTYGMYKVLSDINLVGYKELDFNENLSSEDLELISGAKLVFICRPNNPTGAMTSEEFVQMVLEAADGLVVVDEAYIDFADDGGLINKLSNNSQLIVLQTFSKSFGLAGIRLGMGFMSPEVITVLNKVKMPYNVSESTLNIAENALEKVTKVEESISEIKNERKRVENELNLLQNVEEIFPSEANFLLVRFKGAQELFDYLLDKGIVVRNRTNVRGCEECLRISIGTPEQNNELLETIKVYCDEESLVY